MATHANNIQGPKTSIAAAGQEQQAKYNPSSEIFDERPGANAQRKLQVTANASPNVQQLNAYQDMANTSSQVKQLQAYQDMVNQKQLPDSPLKPTNGGLPTQLKSGIEHLSGYSMDDVKVHYNSEKPIQLNALAYAQGTDIHIASGQDKHLAHEAWHVVQQKQGRVQPHMQLKTGVPVNDDTGLEKEADEMGQRAMQEGVVQNKSARSLLHKGITGSGTVQRVKGGLEYTEAGGTTLNQWQPSANGGLAPFNVAPHAVSILGSYITLYAVPAGTFDPAAADNADFIALQAGLMKLENDVESAEWIIQRHNQDYSKENFKLRLGEDWIAMWNKREALRQAILNEQGLHGGSQIVFVEGNSAANLTQASAARVFAYHAQGNAGSVQITMGYKGSSTMKNIAMSNVSRFLPGRSDNEETRKERVGGTSLGTKILDRIGGASQWLNANALHESLKADMTPVEAGLFKDIFSTDQLATVQLLVLMDTMARRATSDAGDGAEASGKNIQRYFPKSMRDSYVREMLGTDVSDIRMTAIRGRLTAAIAASVDKFYTALDAIKLPVAAFREAHPAQEDASQAAQHDVATANDGNRAARETTYKDLILGTQLNFIATATDIIGAYTDISADSSGQKRGDNPANDYEYMVSVKAPQVIPRGNGAVFEDRSEVPIGNGELGNWNEGNALRVAVESLLKGA